jgi:serine/threonine-protein kinase
MPLPMSKDAVTGPNLEENLALVEVMAGEASQAISRLQHLLQIPYGGNFLYYRVPLTPALLRLDPLWDPLRSDPDFQKLCEEKKP